jgi:hypothetical protein
VGCLGRLERCEEAPGGRFLIGLKGLSRFRAREELPLLKGYRRVRADYREFSADLRELEAQLDPEPLKQALVRFGERSNAPFDLSKLDAVAGIALLNGLCMSLPFAPVEKQALLEAPTPTARERVLLGLMGMGLELQAEPEPPAPPRLN